MNRKVDTKARVLLQTMPLMQDGCTTALGVFAVDFNSRRRSRSVIHPCLMSSFSMASLSWSDGGWSMLRWCAIRCTIRKPTTAYGEMMSHMRDLDFPYTVEIYCICNRKYTKMTTLG